jgi:hypothetical protein
MPGAVTGYRAHTVVPVNWKVLSDEHGNRYIEGIAYNAAIKGERRQVTCSDEVWHNPDEDVFYGDESVRWTVDELKSLNLKGVPIRVQHSGKLPKVGSILKNWVDPDGNLHIRGAIPGDSDYGRAAISLVDSGACQELSISYPLLRNPRTHEVSRMGVDEVSIVTDAHFRGCKVMVRAGKKEARTAPYTLFSAVRDTTITLGPASETFVSVPDARDEGETPLWFRWVRGKERFAKMHKVGNCNARTAYSFNSDDRASCYHHQSHQHVESSRCCCTTSKFSGEGTR